MAKNAAGANTENLRDEDFSSEDMETHKPGAAEEGEMDVDERAYVLMEYINLEWPAQSIVAVGPRLYFGTNPATAESSCELIEIDLENADYTNLSYRDAKIGRFVNKIRHHDGRLYALSDAHLTVYGTDLKQLAEVQDSFAYGLCVTADAVFAGTSDGRLVVYDHSLNVLSSGKLHRRGIEAIEAQNGLVYTGSIDGTLKVSNGAHEVLHTIENGAEINCMAINGNKLVYGDDNSVIHLVSLDTFEREAISWHNTPITALKWKDSDVFVSASDEQVCVWDTSLDEEWDYHKYLLFVHQGQKYYKDIALLGDVVVTSSIDGLCCFTPVSFTEVE
ncbi:hypothetical protein PAPHI01_0421 [Pancytospora philotis]|nr:hypothetical protein PAPHI01_0421 [Pancytospora philotis]